MKRAIIATALVCNSAESQSPLFVGYSGDTYALELKLNQDDQITAIGKTFRTKYSVWGYTGTSFDNDLFSGAGLIMSRKRAHILPTVEGNNRTLTRIAFYSTIDLPNDFYLDLIPSFERNFSYIDTELVLHREMHGISLGAGIFDREPVVKFGKFWKDWSIRCNIRPKQREYSVSVQRNFR